TLPSCRPVAGSQKISSPGLLYSPLTVASVLPSGAKATAQTISSWPRRVRRTVAAWALGAPLLSVGAVRLAARGGPAGRPRRAAPAGRGERPAPRRRRGRRPARGPRSIGTG